MIEEENRREIMGRSIRNGMMKEGLDTIIVGLVNPVSKAIKPMMQKLHPDIDFFDPAVEAGLQMATLNVIAEIVQASSTVADKIPGLEALEIDSVDVEEKLYALSGAMRAYSGEKLGDKAGRMGVLFFPMVKTLLQHSAMLGGGKEAPKALAPKNPNLIELLEMEEGDEQQEAT